TRTVNAEKAQLWLERSKDSSVNINIGSEPFQEASIPKVKLIMRVIIPHLGRCRSLKVQGVPEKVARVIFDRLRDASAPILEVLEISTEDSTKWEPKPFREGNAPPLLDLSIEARFRKYFLERFTNLRRLQLIATAFSGTDYSGTVAYVHRILSMLPRLEILLIDNDKWHVDGGPDESQFLRTGSTSPLMHESLTYLSLWDSRANRNTIVTSLNLPHVRYFPRTHKAPLHETTFGICILEYMQRTHPFPRLVSLCLGGSHRDSHRDPDINQRNAENLAHLEGALDGVPLLESLSFEDVDFGGGETISCLSRVCPRLEWLTLHMCTGCTLKGIMSIMERRSTRTGFQPLRHLTIREYPWDTGLVDDKETWELLGKMLEAKYITPIDLTNLYLTRFDVK
ncbi:hypothetical protein FRC05_010985, partial [Tulasnella sp. 425]